MIANPPFSLKEWGRDFAPNDSHHRFDRYGAIPPKTRGDLAFLQHMLAVTNPTGMVGVVMPHGILFRGGAEGTIRKGIVEADLFEAIIGLAPNLFYGASIPVAVCILNKDKPPERRGKVLFVDANQPDYFRAGKAQNLLEPTSTPRRSSRRSAPTRRSSASPTSPTSRRSRPTTSTSTSAATSTPPSRSRCRASRRP